MLEQYDGFWDYFWQSATTLNGHVFVSVMVALTGVAATVGLSWLAGKKQSDYFDGVIHFGICGSLFTALLGLASVFCAPFDYADRVELVGDRALSGWSKFMDNDIEKTILAEELASAGISRRDQLTRHIFNRVGYKARRRISNLSHDRAYNRVVEELNLGDIKPITQAQTHQANLDLAQIFSPKAQGRNE